MADEEKTYFEYLQFTENGTKYYCKDSEAQKQTGEGNVIATITLSRTGGHELNFAADDVSFSTGAYTAEASTSNGGYGRKTLTIPIANINGLYVGKLIYFRVSNHTSSLDTPFTYTNGYGIISEVNDDNIVIDLYSDSMPSGYFYSTSTSANFTVTFEVIA